MPCPEELRLQAYFDGELDALAAAAVEQHLPQCASCRGHLEGLQQLRGALRSAPLPQAPAALRARIAAALPPPAAAPTPAPRPAAPRRRPWQLPAFWLGAGGGLGAAVAAGLAALLLLPPAAPALLDSMTAAHVRSLMPEHLTDVISTDRHTVKPWFAGHADVSPVVADFSAQGYHLVGGRADYFDRQRVAALVYQHGAHVINVFSWQAGSARLPHTASRSGYHLVCWRATGLQYCAVSDAGWEELQGLATLLQQQAARDNPPPE